MTDETNDADAKQMQDRLKIAEVDFDNACERLESARADIRRVEEHARDWRSVRLESLPYPGIPSDVLDSMAAMGIETIGSIAAYLADTGREAT